MSKLKRNDIVNVKEDWYIWSPYGRVHKILPDNKVEVIFCTRNVEVHDIDELIINNNYKGFWNYTCRFPHFVKMPSMRKLKQNVARVHPEIWKKRKSK